MSRAKGRIVETVSHGNWIRLCDGAPRDDIVSSDDVTHVRHETEGFIMRIPHDGPPEDE